MNISRRNFLATGTTLLAGSLLARSAAAAEAEKARPSIRFSARHFSDDFDAARRAGLEGVEIGVGGPAAQLIVTTPAYRQKYKDMMKNTGVAVSSLSMDLMNGHPAGLDPQAPAWLAQVVEAAGDLGAAGILLPFFGKAHLLDGNEFKKDALDGLVARLKDIAPLAEKAKVSIGVECTLSAGQYLKLLDRVGSRAVGAYYDVGNSTGAGLNVPADLKALKGRLTMIHFKDGNAYLGEGPVKIEPICETLKAIGYQGWCVLETACPSRDAVADCRRNAERIRKLLL